MASSRQGPSPRSRTLRSVVAFVLIVGLAVLTVVAALTVLQPEDPVTAEAEDIDRLYQIVLIPAMLIFWGVEAAIIWFGLRYWEKRDELPSQVHSNNPLEFTWTSIPIGILVILFGLSVPLVVDLRSEPDEGEVGLTVEVIGHQWFWEYQYPVQGVRVFQAPDYENPQPPVMVVPVGTTVELVITSGDVVHSFYVPQFLYKMQAIPGQENRLHFTVKKEGVYDGQCAQFCGLQHAAMLLRVEAVTQEEFQSWVESERQAGHVIPGWREDGLVTAP